MERKTITFASIILDYLKLKWNILKSLVDGEGVGRKEKKKLLSSKLKLSDEVKLESQLNVKLCNIKSISTFTFPSSLLRVRETRKKQARREKKLISFLVRLPAKA